MNWKALHIVYHILFACMLFPTASLLADTDDFPTKKISISKNKGSIYELLQQIAAQTGYHFTYDSQLVNSNKLVKINKGEYRLIDAIRAITGNPKLEVELIENHMLLYAPKEVVAKKSETLKKNFYTITGSLYDRISNHPIAYGYVGINGTNIGTVANLNGEFRLAVPDSLPHIVAKASHLGYGSKELNATNATNSQLLFTLEPQYTSLQEAVVRAINPTLIVHRMLDNRHKNYSHSPVNMTSFYRECIELKKNIHLTESVIRLYKTDYFSLVNNDHAKLVKMRSTSARNPKDTIFVKMKAGVQSALQLDIMKDLPNFLMLNESEQPYTFWHTGITSIDGRDINIISFEQKQHIKDPLYKGLLFIDTENYALTEVQFELNPSYAEKETTSYVLRQPKTHIITLLRALYTISYRPNSNGVYYLSQVRGNIDFKVRKKKSLFSFPLNITFEMIVCDIKTDSVNTFSRDERLQTHKIFSEIKHPYDIDFWGNFNAILPEHDIRKFIQNTLVEVLETSPENKQ